MILDTAELTPRERHKIAIGTVLPRPIAWVSSRSREGRLNLAPFSYFTIVGNDPLTLIFCPSRKPDGSKKDSWRNAEETGEFVVNITNEDTARAMNLSATAFEHGISEFEMAGLTPAAGRRVGVPRVAEAPVAYECHLHQIVEVGESAAIFGRVVSIYLSDDVYDGNYVHLDRLRPIGRLAGAGYCRVTDLFEMERLSVPAAMEHQLIERKKGDS